MSYYDPSEEIMRRMYKAVRDTMRDFEREFEEIERDDGGDTSGG